MVERTHGWLNRFRAILIRWEKKIDNHVAALHLACAYYTLSRAGVFGSALSVGHWLYQYNRSSGLTGIIPMVELHHSSVFGDGDIVSTDMLDVGNFRGTVSQTSFFAATTLELGSSIHLTSGYATPLDTGQYDGAFTVQLDRSF